MRNTLTRFLLKYSWLFSFLFFICILCWKVVFKGYVIGPFDFLVGFYHPFRDIEWPSANLQNAALLYKNYLMSDVVTVVLPVKLLAVSMLKHFELPLWNPYILDGTPLFANIQSAILYPLTILYFIFDLKTAFNIYIISQPILAFIFMYLYLGSLHLPKIARYLGALCFSCSAFIIVWMPWGTLGHAFLWLPLILYAMENMSVKYSRIYSALFLMGLVFSFFAGHTQISLVVYLITLLYIALKFIQNRNIKLTIHYVVLYLLSCVIVSVQLLPAMVLYKASVRDLVATSDFYKGTTLNYSSYLMALVPDFFGNPVTRNWWGKINYAESAVYFGTTAVYFVIYSFLRYKKIPKSIFFFYLGLIIAAFFISTENIVPAIIYNMHLPIISSSTFSRYSVIVMFSCTVLTAYGFFIFLEDIKQKYYKKIYIINGLFIICIGILWACIFTQKLPNNFVEHIDIIKHNSYLPTALLISVMALSFVPKLLSILKNERATKTAFTMVPLIIILLTSIDLLRFSQKYMPFSPGQFFYPPHSLTQRLSELTKINRYYQYFPTNINSMYRIRGVEGYEPLYNQSLGELSSMGEKGKVDIHDRATMQFPDGKYKQRILDLFSVEYFVDKTDNFRNSWIKINGDGFDNKFKEIWTDGIYKIYRNSYFLNRQGVFYNAEIIKNKNKALQRLIDPKFDAKSTLIFEENIRKPTTKGSYKIKIVNDGSMEQTYNVTTSQPGIFFVNDTFYPGWDAFVDDVKQPIIRANHIGRAIFIEKGSHTIHFVYNPLNIKWSFVLSIAGILASCLYIFKSRIWKIN